MKRNRFILTSDGTSNGAIAVRVAFYDMFGKYNIRILQVQHIVSVNRLHRKPTSLVRLAVVLGSQLIGEISQFSSIVIAILSASEIFFLLLQTELLWESRKRR